MSKDLKIGILGASRIAAEGIIEPAETLGHRLQAVAARDLSRAQDFADEHGVQTAYGSYQELIDDPEVELIYNGLINSAHAAWNVAAMRAGKHVLSEKPLTGNAQRSREVVQVARDTGRLLVEGFHYIHHPVHARMRDLVTSGQLGEIQDVEITLAIPAPPESDPRWKFELAGGATMDLGCYVLDALRHFGTWIGVEPEILTAEASLWSENMDSALDARVAFGAEISARARWDMSAADRVMTWTVRGSAGAVTSPAFAVPHTDPRLRVEKRGAAEEIAVSGRTSYSFQLERVAQLLEGKNTEIPHDVNNSVQTAELVDRAYELAKLPLRPGGK